MHKLQDSYDLVIIGSGGGSMTAALAAKDLGLSVVILEKMDKVGGSTSYSGGVWWVPQNHLLAEAGIADSYDKADLYLDQLVTTQTPAASPQRRKAFLQTAPDMLRFIADKGMKLRRPREPWPDYYDDRAGGLPEGRSVMPEHFDLRQLGAWKDHLAIYPPMYGMPIGADEFPTLFLMKRTWAGKAKAMQFAMRMAWHKLCGRINLPNGAAIQGRMLQILLRENLPLFRETPVEQLLVENGQVTGVVARHAGKRVEVRARYGVIANVGGFSRNGVLRQSVTDRPAGNEWTSANPGDTGEILQEMLALGAATENLDAAWWVLTSRHVDGSWPKGAVHKDGRILPFMHHLDLSLPHLIMVDRNGKRFADESGSYMEIGERMHDRHRDAQSCFPAWVIMDQTNRDRYPWGGAAPGQTPKEWLNSGYMKKADSLEALAQLCGIDTAGLMAEVQRFNGFCQTGVDADFGRGSRAFDRSHGDPTVTPNPNLGPLIKGPFYAVAMYPGDVGTCGGVVTDAFARVLRQDHTAIQGLYAIGNTAASPFGRAYPGAGASIAASFTFGYIAAHHAAGKSLPFQS